MVKGQPIHANFHDQGKYNGQPINANFHVNLLLWVNLLMLTSMIDDEIMHDDGMPCFPFSFDEMHIVGFSNDTSCNTFLDLVKKRLDPFRILTLQSNKYTN